MHWLNSTAVAGLVLLASLSGALAADLGSSEAAYGAAAPEEVRYDQKWFLHVGPLALMPSESAKIRLGGQHVPGATISVPDQYTLGISLGYHFTPNIAVALSTGLPPVAKINGGGAAEPFGFLGKTLYGPSALTLQYHYRDLGWFQPYVGAGPMLMSVLDVKDGAVKNLKINYAVGATAQIGVNMMATENWGVFIDLKKAYLRTRAKGYLAGAPMRADVTLDPLVLTAGVTYRF